MQTLLRAPLFLFVWTSLDLYKGRIADWLRHWFWGQCTWVKFHICLSIAITWFFLLSFLTQTGLSTSQEFLWGLNEKICLTYLTGFGTLAQCLYFYWYYCYGIFHTVFLFPVTNHSYCSWFLWLFHATQSMQLPCPPRFLKCQHPITTPPSHSLIFWYNSWNIASLNLEINPLKWVSPLNPYLY